MVIQKFTASNTSQITIK